MFHRLQSPLGSLTSQGSQSESRSETSQSNGRKAPLTDLDVKPDDILVLQNAGPHAAGMPEAGYLPIPKKLAQAGVKDMVRISDARMSGTAFGSIVLHVAPEAAVGGPLAAVRNGDRIRLSIENKRIDLLVEPDEIAQRLAGFTPPPAPRRGYKALYRRTVTQAPEGCDFDFLTADHSPVDPGEHSSG
ncbi:dihydroxy-acid dehydratase [Bradyrhizobium japonicum]|nr:dihydroxy-acid dehydratase [Bradyrhizobium japonicum]